MTVRVERSVKVVPKGCLKNNAKTKLFKDKNRLLEWRKFVCVDLLQIMLEALLTTVCCTTSGLANMVNKTSNDNKFHYSFKMAKMCNLVKRSPDDNFIYPTDFMVHCIYLFRNADLPTVFITHNGVVQLTGADPATLPNDDGDAIKVIMGSEAEVKKDWRSFVDKDEQVRILKHLALHPNSSKTAVAKALGTQPNAYKFFYSWRLLVLCNLVKREGPTTGGFCLTDFAAYLSKLLKGFDVPADTKTLEGSIQMTGREP